MRECPAYNTSSIMDSTINQPSSAANEVNEAVEAKLQRVMTDLLRLFTDHLLKAHRNANWVQEAEAYSAARAVEQSISVLCREFGLANPAWELRDAINRQFRPSVRVEGIEFDSKGKWTIKAVRQIDDEV